MIAITVTSGIVVYVYASGLMGPLEGVKVQQPYLEKITLDYYQWNWKSSTAGNLTLELRNTGSTQITLADVFIIGQPVARTFGSGCSSGTLGVNAPGCQVSITYTGLAITSGNAYNVRVVTSDGAIFDFSCIAGATS